jgi:hypothetical protein
MSEDKGKKTGNDEIDGWKMRGEKRQRRIQN